MNSHHMPLPPAKSDGTVQPVGGLSACGHTFRIIKPDATWGEEALILRRVVVCGVEGFALHYDDLGFRVSHIETGALCSEGYASSAQAAITSAEYRLSSSAQHRKTTPAKEMDRCIALVKEAQARASANAPSAPAADPAGGKK